MDIPIYTEDIQILQLRKRTIRWLLLLTSSGFIWVCLLITISSMYNSYKNECEPHNTFGTQAIVLIVYTLVQYIIDIIMASLCLKKTLNFIHQGIMIRWRSNLDKVKQKICQNENMVKGYDIITNNQLNANSIQNILLMSNVINQEQEPKKIVENIIKRGGDY